MQTKNSKVYKGSFNKYMDIKCFFFSDLFFFIISRLPYSSIFGGAGAFLRKDFEEINGFSNKFWGWGGEDDDLYQRFVFLFSMLHQLYHSGIIFQNA